MNAWLLFFLPHPYLQSKKLDSVDLQKFSNAKSSCTATTLQFNALQIHCSTYCTANTLQRPEDLDEAGKIPNIQLL